MKYEIVNIFKISESFAVYSKKKLRTSKVFHEK